MSVGVYSFHWRTIVAGIATAAIFLFMAVTAWGETVNQTIQVGGEVDSIAVSPDGKLIAISSGNSKVQIFKAEDGSVVCTSLTVPGSTPLGEVVDLAFSSDGKTLYGYDIAGNRIIAWDVASCTFLKEFAKEGNPAGNSMAICPSPKAPPAPFVVIESTKPGYIIILDQDGNKLGEVQVLGPNHNSTSPVIDIAFSPDCSYIVTVGGPGGFKEPEAKYACIVQGTYSSGKWTWTCKKVKLPGMGINIAISPYGKIVVATASNGVVVIDKEKGTSKTLEGSKDFKRCVFLSDGQTIACASNDGTIGFWDSKTGKLKSKVKVEGCGQPLAAGPNNSVYVGCSNGSVKKVPQPSATSTPTPTKTSSPSPTQSPSPTPSSSPNPTPTMSPTPTLTPTPFSTPNPSPSL